MSTTTTNYGFIKPALTDVPDITAPNGNWDTVDRKLKEHDTAVENIANGSQVLKSVKVQNADNGYGHILKNNSANADYGTNFQDVANDGKFMKLSLIANQQRAILDFNGEQHDIAKADEVLPLTGGTLSGDLRLGNSMIVCTDIMNAFYICGDRNRYNALLIEGVDEYPVQTAFRVARYDGGVYNSYPIFGENNKPFGSYTGNGSASKRTIDTKGIGRLLLVYKEGSDIAALVTPQGALVKNIGEADGTQAGSAFFVNGVFTIATTSAYFNQSGATYYYQVI